MVKKLIVIFVLGAVVRCLILFIGLEAGGERFILNYGDAAGYTRLAQNMFLGHGFSMSRESPFIPDGTRTPIYPGFLASSLFLSGNFWLAIAFQIVLGSLIPILAYFLLQKLKFIHPIPLGVAIFFSIEPFFAAHGVFLLSEVIFISIFLLTCIFYFKSIYASDIVWKWIVLAAFFTGLSALTRPIGFYLIFIFAAGIFLFQFKQWRKSLLAAAIFSLVGFATISPWLYRNWQVFGSATLSSIDSINLYLQQGGSVLANYNNTTLDIEKKKLWDELKSDGLDYKNIGDAKEIKKRAWVIISSHPAAFLKVNSLAAWQFFTHDAYYDLAWHLGFYHERNSPPITILDFKNSIFKIPKLLAEEPLFIIYLLGRALWVLIFFSFLAGIYLAFKKRLNVKREVFLISIIIYFLAASVTTGYSINARFRLPIAVFYVTYASLALQYFYQNLKRRSAITHNFEL